VAIPTVSLNGRTLRRAYQILQIRVQKVGRGITNEILMLHINGKQYSAGVKTLDELLNYLGSQGFEVVTTEMETEGIYTYFYTLQREVLTDQPIEHDIFDELASARPGATFGQGVRGFFEFIGMADNW
jgi:hypothetical protein